MSPAPAISGSLVVTVVDEPSIGAVTPLKGSQTGSDKRPVISAELINAGENPTVEMTVNGEKVNAVCAGGKATYTPAADMTDGRTNVTVTVTRADGKYRFLQLVLHRGRGPVSAVLRSAAQPHPVFRRRRLSGRPP